jgi:hypothetical protein
MTMFALLHGMGRNSDSFPSRKQENMYLHWKRA